MPKKIGQDASSRITSDAAVKIRTAIAETGGREVFFAASLNAAALVDRVRVLARGNEGAVPAVFEDLRLREVVIHNHPGGNITPSDADIQLAAIFGHNGHGVYIVDNDVNNIYVVIEPFLDKDKSYLSIKELASVLGPGSRIAQALPEYELRPQQTVMMEQVADAFNRDGIAVVEAPTGVGKTLAYLLPAVFWAQRNRERVVISTRTINLQEQIIQKDIPLLRKCLDKPFSSILVKGRSNYICRRRLERAMAEATLFDDDAMREQLNALAAWAKKSEDGSRSDLPFVPFRDVWDRVCSEADTCAGNRCPSNKECFVSKARREMAKADLLVVNHHMLFTDLAIKKEVGDFHALSVLPAYSRVIFDEAHNIEDSATEYFGIEVSRIGTLALLGRFVHFERGQERGILPLLKIRLVRDLATINLDRIEPMLTVIDNQLLPSIEAAREAVTAAFDMVRSYVAEHSKQIGRDIKWRLTDQLLAEPELRELHTTFVLSAVEELTACARYTNELCRLLAEIKPGPEETESPVLFERLQLQSYRDRLLRAAAALSEGTSDSLLPNTVRWIEIDAGKPVMVRMVRCPLDSGALLAEWVYPNLKTVLMTSATLTIQHTFDFLLSRVGLDRLQERHVETTALDSPFDFEQQALLCIPKDIVSPDSKDFLVQSVDCIRDTLTITRGHAFVLFTSFYALNFAYDRLADELRRQGIASLKQGQAPRTHLLERFRRDASSVLFATDSFWEGVDVAGEALQCVILPKLPFRVPTEPIQEARAEAIDAQGGNSFMSYTVPQAVMKFRQGFGRLIRRKTDRGVIVVLDHRVLMRHYGRLFLKSLPEMRTVSGPWKNVAEELAGFFVQNSAVERD